MQILKAVTMVMVMAISFFWSFMRNPAIKHKKKKRAQKYPKR
jgi:hypothetical protein